MSDLFHLAPMLYLWLYVTPRTVRDATTHSSAGAGVVDCTYSCVVWRGHLHALAGEGRG